MLWVFFGNRYEGGPLFHVSITITIAIVLVLFIHSFMRGCHSGHPGILTLASQKHTPLPATLRLELHTVGCIPSFPSDRNLTTVYLTIPDNSLVLRPYFLLAFYLT